MNTKTGRKQRRQPTGYMEKYWPDGTKVWVRMVAVVVVVGGGGGGVFNLLISTNY